MKEEDIIITKEISVEPIRMNYDILKSLVFMFRSKYEKKCLEEGLIWKIKEITNIQNMIEKDSCHIYFSISAKVLAVRPEKESITSFKPLIINDKGVFGRLYDDNISLFIPQNKLKDWEFEDGCYIQKNKKISKERIVDVIITDFKYITNKYNCICKLLT